MSNELTGDGYGLRKVLSQVKAEEKLQGLHQSNTSYLFWLLSLIGRHVSTSSRSSSGPNLKIQVLHKLAHKMQVAIPVA